jgi:capsular exopolysaccharide synthesis family protein
LDVAQAESQIQVIRSERILAAVFDVLNLIESKDFVEGAPSFLSRIFNALGIVKHSSFDVLDRRARAFQSFSDRVSVRRLGQSYVIEVGYSASSPEQAARIANAIAVQYIKAQIDVKAAAASQGTEYLRGRIINIEAEQKAALEGVRDGRVPDMLFSDADARIIGAALKPLNKSYPKTGLVLAFAAVFGLVTGLLSIAIRHALDRSINIPRQIHELLSLKCLGALPPVSRGRERGYNNRLSVANYIDSNPKSEYSLSLRRIRAEVSLLASDGSNQVIAITSWSPREGKSSVAYNLAHLFALSGSPVKLIDADFRNMALTSMLAPDCSIGLNDFLMDQSANTDFERSILSIEVSHFMKFLPAVGSNKEVDPNVFLGSSKFTALLKQSRGEGAVIIDLAPISTRSDAQAVSRAVDGFILVVEAHRTTVEQISESVRLLEAAGGNVIGVVLNKAREKFSV